MRVFVSFTAYLLSSYSSAHYIICEQPNSVEATSSLMIEYDNEDKPHKIYLKSPDSDQWREQNVLLQPISGSPSEDVESISVRPKKRIDIDWSNQPQCFIETGTQWYIHLDHQGNNDYVQLVPFIQTKEPSCRPPRFPPQIRGLKCNDLGDYL